MKKLITNAFSLNMLAALPASVSVEEVSVSEAAGLATDRHSVVGHADIAAVMADVLGVPVPFNRESVTLSKGDSLLVGQYRGPRLPEGATELPADAQIQWLLVSI